MKDQEIIKAIKKADEQDEVKYWKSVSLENKIKFKGIIKN